MVSPFALSLGEGNPTSADWANGADACVTDAITLLASGSAQNAYMLGGLAVELALKGRIMHTNRWNRWPSRKTRPDVHSHILGNLMSAAGLKPALEQEVLLCSDIGLAWMVVKDFDISTRYPLGKPFPKRTAVDFVDAIDSLGLVQWLTTGIR